LAGTPSYMAPEQTTGEPASEASDVFALGVILFEMLAGRRAFPSKNLLQVLDQIRRVDAEALASEVPEPFAPILRLALARDPDDRTITMRQIAEWLGASLQPANAR
jgi:eukaryotic-like serine/threonine-protein kinase